MLVRILFIKNYIVYVKAKWSTALGVAAFFGFSSMVLYGIDAVIKFKGWRAGGGMSKMSV